MDYETLVRTRITNPLGMTNTVVQLSADQRARLAIGHNSQLASVANWDLPTLAGAGALRSTTNDLLTLLAANLGTLKSTLAPAMAAMLTSQRPTGTPGLEVALGWHVFTRDGNDLVWHNGGTGGYHSFIGYDARTGVGVSVLSNAATIAGIDDIGLHVLDARFPVLQAPTTHTQTTVDPNCSISTSASTPWRPPSSSLSRVTAIACSCRLLASLDSSSLPRARRITS